MSVLTYTAWWSALDRQLIDAALATAGLPYHRIVVLGAPTPPSGVSEPAAVQMALDVVRVVASRLPQPFPEERRQDLEQRLAEIILLAANARISATSSLETFEAMVRDALPASWPSPKPRARSP